jgi:2,5-diketo-D-gluconate reductase B
MIHVSCNGVKIPALGYGTWRLEGVRCEQGVEKALEIGYRHIDTAQIYENEGEVGAALLRSGVPRGEIFLTTKVWTSELREKAFMKSVDVSLKKLRTDTVDLLLIHWPVQIVPFADQMQMLRMAQELGKARLIGVSNFTVAQMKQVAEDLGAGIAVNQVEYHPYLSQRPVLDYLRAHDMVLTAYSPLARGKVNDDPVLQRIGAAYGKTPGQVALRWLVQQDRVTAIPKAASEKHMRENFSIFDFELHDDEMNAISALARPDGRLVNPDWAPQWDKVA